MLGAISIKKVKKNVSRYAAENAFIKSECERECMRSPILCKRSSLQDRVNALLMRFVSFQDKRKTPYYRPPTEWRRLCFQSCLSISPFVRVKGRAAGQCTWPQTRTPAPVPSVQGIAGLT